jgi:two-component system alkaline phosphatase synthesis response regulator PhoP
MPAELVLIVDDEPSIVQLARLYLERERFRVEAVGDGEAALQAIKRLRPALVVLDVMLPGMDGFELCRRLRVEKDPVAILMVTARDEDIDRILGLEMGADDYLVKPFNPRELVARVRAILRRTQHRAPLDAQPLQLGELTVDPIRRQARIGNRELELRTQEFELLLILAGQPERVFTREQLLREAWDFDFLGQTRTVDVHIAHLRRKLLDSSVRIETITGVGYKLVA